MRTPALLALPLLLSACAGDFDRSVCQPAPADQLEQIASTLTVQGGGTLADGFAVPRDTAWTFISARVMGPGLESGDAIATWIRHRAGMTLSANTMAEEFSGLGPVRTTDIGGIERDEAAEVSRQCVRTAP